MWTTNGVVQDAGGAAGGPSGTGYSEIGITNTGLPFCINDGPVTLPYHRLCLGANSPQITEDALGGAPQDTFSFAINGVIYPFPGPGDTSTTHVATEAALAAYAVQTTTVIRDGYYNAGDGGVAVYTLKNGACSLNSGAGDGGSQVPFVGGGKCWTGDFKAVRANILQWGALANDSTDLGQYIQAAYNANIGCVNIPAGIYKITLGVTIAANSPCFYGDGWNEAVTSPSAKTGTWIHITDTSLLPFTITAVTGQGATPGFSNMAFFEDQPADVSGWTPNPYQYIFTLNGNLGRVDFTNVFFYNTTHCISFLNSARSRIKVAGMPVGTCLQIDQAFDVIYLDEVEFWPFWNAATNNTVSYNQVNVDPVVFKRADSPFIGNYFTFGYHSGIEFSSSSAGATTGAQISNLLLDACKYCIWITGTNTQLQISNARTAGGTLTPGVAITGSDGYRDESNGTSVTIANFDCFFEGSHCVNLTGTSPGEVQIGNSLIWSFNYDNNSSTGIASTAGGVVALAVRPSQVNPLNGGTLLPTTPVNAATGPYFNTPGSSQNWAPVLAGSTTAGTATYTTNVGSFWDTGGVVTVTFNIMVNGSLSGAVGNLEIRGLPRTRTGVANQSGTCSISTILGQTLDSGYTTLVGLVPGGSGVNQIQLIEAGSPTLATLLAPVAVAGTNFGIQGECAFRSD